MNNNKYNAPSIKKQNQILKETVKHNPPKRPERVSDVKEEIEIKDFNSLLQKSFRNELDVTQLVPGERHLLLDNIKTRSQLLSSIVLVGTERFEVEEVTEDDSNNLTLSSIALNSTKNSERLIVHGGEYFFKEVDGVNLGADKLEVLARTKIEKAVVDLLENTVETKVSKDTDIIDKVMKIKEILGKDNLFTLCVDSKTYMKCARDFKNFPYKIIHVPTLTENTVVGMIIDKVFCNCLLGDIDVYKNIMTGVTTVGLSILILDTFAKNGSVVKIVEEK